MAAMATDRVNSSRLHLFDHLPKKEKENVNKIEMSTVVNNYTIHPATIKLGDYYRTGIIRDDDDRVIALIVTLKTIVSDYVVPPMKSMQYDLDKYISIQIQYLIKCRQHCIGMGNVIKFLRYVISQIPTAPPGSSTSTCSEESVPVHAIDKDSFDRMNINAITSALSEYLEERIIVPRRHISNICSNTINDNDVIMTFGTSPLIQQVLLESAKTLTFKVVIVDTRPLLEGKKTLEVLTKANIECIYTLLPAASVVMNQVTRVMLGCSSVLSNGSVLAPAGTAMIATLAKSKRIPVMFLCESYKFSYKVQLDSIVYNELGSINEIAIPISNYTSNNLNNNYMNCTSIGTSSLDYNDVVLNGGAGSNGAVGATITSNSSTHAPNGINVNFNQDVYHQYRLDTDDLDSGSGSSPLYSIPQLDPSYRGNATSTNTLPFSIINLRYDITPIGNVDAIAMEAGLIPPTSVPILIKEYSKNQP